VLGEGERQLPDLTPDLEVRLPLFADGLRRRDPAVVGEDTGGRILSGVR